MVMSHLVVTLEDKLVGEFPITKEKMTIGRKPDNDICINNLAISSYHTQIITVLDSSFLEDLNSTNGTYVNARLVKKHALEDGDLIDIGNYRIRYVGNEPKQNEKAESDVLEKTIVLSPNDHPEAIDEFLKKESTVVQDKPTSTLSNHPAPIIDTRDEDEVKVEEEPAKQQATPAAAEPEKTAPAPVAPAAANPQQTTSEPERIGKLQVLNGKNAGLVLDLKKSLTTFGSPKVAVAGVTKRAKGYFLVHVQGQEGQATLLNGEKLKAKATQLEDNDIIEVANIKLEFFTE